MVRQSDRFPIYDAAIADLRTRGLVYECFCTRREILAEIAASSAAPHGPPGSYPGTCRELDASAVARPPRRRPSARTATAHRRPFRRLRRSSGRAGGGHGRRCRAPAQRWSAGIQPRRRGRRRRPGDRRRRPWRRSRVVHRASDPPAATPRAAAADLHARPARPRHRRRAAGETARRGDARRPRGGRREPRGGPDVDRRERRAGRTGRADHPRAAWSTGTTRLACRPRRPCSTTRTLWCELRLGATATQGCPVRVLAWC